MKVKKFVGELDNLNANWIEGDFIPQIVDKEGKTYRISSVDFSKNSIVYLVAASSKGLNAKEFDKLMTRIRLIRPNATIAVKISNTHHVNDVYVAWHGNDNFINIDIGAIVKEK